MYVCVFVCMYVPSSRQLLGGLVICHTYTGICHMRFAHTRNICRHMPPHMRAYVVTYAGISCDFVVAIWWLCDDCVRIMWWRCVLWLVMTLWWLCDQVFNVISSVAQRSHRVIKSLSHIASRIMSRRVTRVTVVRCQIATSLCAMCVTHLPHVHKMSC